ncbi:PREDICTED: centromere protein I-like isoform X2 [Priapulus caudatus]|nr:PREDICTED: centromere protein I-like isoform X2 [Priapulus caudatus]
MCPYICHLLHLLTRREDVRLFRIRRLLNLQSRVGVQTYISGLLSIYRLYYPNIVSLVMSGRRKIFFKNTDTAWAQVIRKVQARANAVQRPITVQVPSLAVRGTKPRHKRAKLQLVPSLQSAVDQTDVTVPTDSIQTSISITAGMKLEQIHTFEDLLTNVDRLELPMQVAALLRHPHLQHLLLCSSDRLLTTRLSYWLHHTLQEELILGNGENDAVRELLDMVVTFTDFIQEGVPVLDDIIIRYLMVWNGRDYRSHVLQLITRMGMMPFSDLRECILEPLRQIYCSSSVYVKCQVLYCLLQLLTNYSALEWVTPDPNSNTLPLPNTTSVFSPKADTQALALTTIQELIAYIDKLCVLGLTQERDHAFLMHYTLSYMELASTLGQRFGVPLQQVVSAFLIYRCVFALHAMAVSRVCGVICDYCEQYRMMAKKAGDAGKQEGWDFIVNTLNGYTLDICDTLWRSKAFSFHLNPKRSTMIYHLTSADAVARTRVANFHTAFSLLQHPALMGFTQSFLKQQPDEDRSLGHAHKHRGKLLTHLQERHLQGVDRFIHTFIRSKD